MERTKNYGGDCKGKKEGDSGGGRNSSRMRVKLFYVTISRQQVLERKGGEE